MNKLLISFLLLTGGFTFTISPAFSHEGNFYSSGEYHQTQFSKSNDKDHDDDDRHDDDNHHGKHKEESHERHHRR